MTDKSAVQGSAISRPAARQKGQRTRQAIIDEARRILVDEGYENFVLRQIAKNIGIQPGNLEYYFPTKKDLVWEVLAPENDKYTVTYGSMVRNATTPSEKILAMVDFLLEDIKLKATCTIWYTIWALAPHDAEIADVMDQWYQSYLASLGNLLQQTVPTLSAERAHHLARIITALMDGLTNQIGFGKPDHPTMKGFEDEIRRSIVMLFELS